MIFLLLKCYVKPILANFRGSKTAILTILAALNKEKLEFFDIFKCKILQNKNTKPPKLVKMAVFDPLKSIKIGFT